MINFLKNLIPTGIVNKMLLSSCLIFLLLSLGIGALYIDQVERTQICATSMKQKQIELAELQASLDKTLADFEASKQMFNRFVKETELVKEEFRDRKEEFSQKKCESKQRVFVKKASGELSEEEAGSIAADISNIYRLLDSSTESANKDRLSP